MAQVPYKLSIYGNADVKKGARGCKSVEWPLSTILKTKLPICRELWGASENAVLQGLLQAIFLVLQTAYQFHRKVVWWVSG